MADAHVPVTQNMGLLSSDYTSATVMKTTHIHSVQLDAVVWTVQHLLVGVLAASVSCLDQF